MSILRIADLHCHPNLKTFGQSFSVDPQSISDRSHLWHRNPPSAFTKILNALTGLTKFTQADFSTLSKGNIKLAVISLYPMEKGFFNNTFLSDPLIAYLASWVTSIGYQRVRYLQKHTDYFRDLINEYAYLRQSSGEAAGENQNQKWQFGGSWPAIEKLLGEEHTIAVIPTIEGAHVLNTGLHPFGRHTDIDEVFANIRALKNWEYPPFFITLAHNFYNELCGHAPCLYPLGPLVDQSQGLHTGFTELGRQVVHALLDEKGSRILIDVKHMSLKSRFEYYELVDKEYGGKIPIIVSHGAAIGRDRSGQEISSVDTSLFMDDTINFYDEELVAIARSGGIFALQLDANRLINPRLVKKSVFKVHRSNACQHSARVIWRQLQHIAEVLDHHQLPAWDTVCIGSDFDGNINPLDGIWTAESLPLLVEELLVLAESYLRGNHRLSLRENRFISPEEIVQKFVFDNAVDFLRKHY